MRARQSSALIPDSPPEENSLKSYNRPANPDGLWQESPGRGRQSIRPPAREILPSQSWSGYGSTIGPAGTVKIVHVIRSAKSASGYGTSTGLAGTFKPPALPQPAGFFIGGRGISSGTSNANNIGTSSSIGSFLNNDNSTPLAARHTMANHRHHRTIAHLRSQVKKTIERAFSHSSPIFACIFIFRPDHRIASYRKLMSASHHRLPNHAILIVRHIRTTIAGNLHILVNLLRIGLRKIHTKQLENR